MKIAIITEKAKSFVIFPAVTHHSPKYLSTSPPAHKPSVHISKSSLFSPQPHIPFFTSLEEQGEGSEREKQDKYR
jgi:hypothetical protein